MQRSKGQDLKVMTQGEIRSSLLAPYKLFKWMCQSNRFAQLPSSFIWLYGFIPAHFCISPTVMIIQDVTGLRATRPMSASIAP